MGKKQFLWIPFFGIVAFLLVMILAGASDSENKSKVQSNILQNVTPPPFPDKLEFAGEEVPLQYFDVRENMERELMVNTYFHSQTLRYLKLAPRYFSIIEPILKQDTIPDDFKYLALAESGFDPRIVSPAGAAGIWQFLKSTAKEHGLEVNDEVDERYNIEKATHAAALFLKESYLKYGNWAAVAASFNMGRNSLNRMIDKQKEDSYYNLLLPDETNRYVYRILSLKLILESPEKYGYFLSEKDKYPVVPFTLIEIHGSVPDWADFAKSHGINYKMLKMFNPWLRETYLKNPAGKTYQIKIPAKDFRETN